MASVLLVDDSDTLRGLVARTLSRAGYSVVEAVDGKAGLTAAMTKRFDLVISDLNMPVMDGFAFIQRLRVLATYKSVPVLILTTEIDPEKKKAAKAIGATGWIIKPFDPAELLATVQKVLA